MAIGKKELAGAGSDRTPEPADLGIVRIGISSCLLGHRVRYDGGHKLDASLLEAFGPSVSWYPICPETESGMPVPREPLHLVGDPAATRLETIHTGVDHTDAMLTFARRRLDRLATAGLSGFILKSRSPSCGLPRSEGAPPSGATAAGGGLFARAILGRFPFLPAEDEERLRDPRIRNSFVERVFLLARRAGV